MILFLDKNDAGDRERLDALLLESHYLILPTKADCSPVVFCEAFACGLPVVTCAVGGVPEIVTHGVNGFVVDSDAHPDAYADLIEGHYSDGEAYLRFRRAARDAYESTFNWQEWARRIRGVAEEFV